MKTFGLIFLGLILALLFDFIIDYATNHYIFYYVKCWLNNLKKSRSGVVYIVRKAPNLYLKEDYSYSKLGDGLAPLLFYSVDSAKKTMELLDWDNSNWAVIETNKDILSNVISWSRSEEPKKENFHKFKIDDRLSINENRKANGIEPITRRCCNCDHSERGNNMWYCFEHSRFMSNNGSCSYWKGEEDA